MQANKGTDERVAHYIRLDSRFFRTTVRWSPIVEALLCFLFVQQNSLHCFKGKFRAKKGDRERQKEMKKRKGGEKK